MDCDSDDSENPNSLIPFVSQFPFLVAEHESEDDGSDEADDSDVETEVIEPQ